MVKLKAFCTVFAIALLVAGAAYAQTTAALTGTVTTDGKPLPGVTVTITSPQMQGSRTTVTGEAGAYSFAALPPGTYKVAFSLEGLKSVTKNATVGLAETGHVDADLKMAAVAEAITVTASAPAVLETTQIATNVTQKTLNELPAGRTIASAVSLAPGVTPGVAGYSISGAPSSENLYLINGVTVNENVRGQPHNLFIEDAVQETTILSGSGISAEYGRFMGGVVSTLTKSGGNQFTGTYRDTLTNPSWTAKTPWATEAKHTDKISQVHEGTLGGFIMRDRLWFFGAGRKQKTTGQAFTSVTNIPYATGNDQKRYEVKLTGQITPQHSLVGSHINVNETQINSGFGSMMDLESLVPSRQLPNTLSTIQYNGILTNNWLIEAGWTKKYFAFKNSGSRYTDFVKGTLMQDLSRGTRMASPTFCGVCDAEQRNNKSWNLKSNYFLNTASLGTHSLVGGVEDFTQRRYANNHQSGSDFRIRMFTGAKIVGTDVFPVVTHGDYVMWTKIFRGAAFNDFTTQSAFVNDKWDFNKNLSFNLGFRYDKNLGKDADGLKVADDSAFSPRLAATYDLRGNGRQRINASYARYVTMLSENIGESFQAGGQPATIYFSYTGPEINTGAAPYMDKYAALKIIGDWVTANGGPDAMLKNPALLAYTFLPGYSSRLTEKLKSPHADEYTFGYGTQIGSNAFIKADYVNRVYKDFYANHLTLATGRVTDPFGNVGDLATTINDNALKRNYKAIQMQGQWNPNRVSIGGSYTYSKTRGNSEAETSGSGTVSINTDFYPEYLNYAQRLPMGWLSSDIRHRARVWASYQVPMPSILGHLNVSALQQYNSGYPYSAAGTIDPSGTRSGNSYTNPPKNPGYTLSQFSTSQTYYFSGRGEFRTDAFQSTDLALNYDYPISKVSLFAKAEVTNVFNKSAVLTPNTTVLTRRSTSSAGLKAFNPWTETPIECPQGAAAATCTSLGANWQKGASFGKPTGVGSYQTPRAYDFSLGLRF